MSIYDLVVAALLVFLALPLLVLVCKVAIDLPHVGLAFTVGLAVVTYVLHQHAGNALVEITRGVVALSTLTLAVSTVIGFVRRPARAAAVELAVARVRRK